MTSVMQALATTPELVGAYRKQVSAQHGWWLRFKAPQKCGLKGQHGLRERCRQAVLEVILLKADEVEMAPDGLSASSGTLLIPSSYSSRLCTTRARASQLPYHNVRPKTLSKGKTAHFYTLVKSIGISLLRVEDLRYLTHSGSRSWKCANSLDVTGLTIRWTSMIQYLRPSPYETNTDGFLLTSRVLDEGLERSLESSAPPKLSV